MAAKAKIPNDPRVLRQKGPEHKPGLQRWVDCNAPQFERCNKVGEPSFQSDDGFVRGLFNVDEFKNVTK